MNERLKVLVFPFYRDSNGDIQYAILKKIDGGPDIEGEYWQSIAGKVEEGETLMEAARREAWEEGGVPANSHFAMLDQKSSYRTADGTVRQYAFAVELPSRTLRLSEEHSEYRWVGRDGALAMLRFNDYKEALQELDARLKGSR
jgi:dihydroneopterin triphosphate diphosphatase